MTDTGNKDNEDIAHCCIDDRVPDTSMDCNVSGTNSPTQTNTNIFRSPPSAKPKGRPPGSKNKPKPIIPNTDTSCLYEQGVFEEADQGGFARGGCG